MRRTIGIDLGTTNSCVATVEDGRSVVIVNANGERTTPSIVAFTRQGERLVGQSARRQAVTNAERTVMSVKRRMGSDWRLNIDGRAFTPQELSAMILRQLKQDAENYLGGEVTDAVITVPAYFNDVQRQATKDAGRIAGLNVLRIINEPTSAALAYGLDNGQTQKIMVYDLGGGTFDVSVIEIGSGVIEVLATGGDNHLGGDDFDARVADWIVQEFKKQQRIDLSRDAAAYQRVREAAETAKKELSTADIAQIMLPFVAQNAQGPVHLDLQLSRAKFNELIADLVDRTQAPVRQALSDAGISARELGMVLLVGGSTRIPLVQQKVKQLTGKEPSRAINPDECVAQGAALQANLLAGDKSIALGANSVPAGSKVSGGILLLDVCPLSLSIETVGGVATQLIRRNTTLPTQYSKIFTTASSFQSSVEINVLQGERPMARDNKSIGRFRLTGIQRALAGVPQIEVTFDIDVNGILKVSARDLATGRQQGITITADDRMSESEIEQARRDAENYAAQDGERREMIEVQREAESLLLKVNTALGKYQKQIDKQERRQIKNACDELGRLLKRLKPGNVEAKQLSEIRESMSRLKNYSAGLMYIYENDNTNNA